MGILIWREKEGNRVELTPFYATSGFLAKSRAFKSWVCSDEIIKEWADYSLP